MRKATWLGQAATAFSLAAATCLAIGQAAAQAVPGNTVPVPPIKYQLGDNMDPLPKDARRPSSDARNFEGNWAIIGGTNTADGKPLPLQPAVLAEITRLQKMVEAGTPVIKTKTFCRPNGPLATNAGGNMFPTHIVQRPDKMVMIAEEGRTMWDIRFADRHGSSERPAYGGNSIAHWEGNTLVVDSVLHKARTPGGPQIPVAGNSPRLHVVSRITRANTGNGDAFGERLIIYQTFDDPEHYTKPFTSVIVMRWRPDMQMLDFDCEEGMDVGANDGRIVEK